jgi:NAD(P)-dependent dehydrogenase (short-subunit alcohol dehydrogenase family)
MKTIILFGASSGIAQAYVKHLSMLKTDFNIICISSSILPNNLLGSVQINLDSSAETGTESKTSITQFMTNYTEQSLADIIDQLKQQAIELHQVIIFNGQLHNEQHMPEKKLEDINSSYFNQIMKCNALTPILCLQSVTPLLNHKTECTITALSARVGSIEDNKLGGWYTYRASKAALNMLFQTAAIELFRRAKQTKLILIHPGTTDTGLSKPFQRNVPKDKLFTPAFVAEQIFELTNNNSNLEYNGEAAYLDWQGKTIAW